MSDQCLVKLLVAPSRTVVHFGGTFPCACVWLCICVLFRCDLARGCVRPSVRQSVRPSVRRSVGHARVEIMKNRRFSPFHGKSRYVTWKYRVILKKVLFSVFSIIKVSKGDKNFTVKSKDTVLSLSKFSWYLAKVKIIKNRHLQDHISQNNHDLNIIFKQK